MGKQAKERRLKPAEAMAKVRTLRTSAVDRWIAAYPAAMLAAA